MLDAFAARVRRKALRRRSRSQPSTKLQKATKDAFALVADARDELGGDEYQAFVAILHQRIEQEVTRLFIGELRRLERGDS
jgi:hypothetical protein